MLLLKVHVSAGVRFNHLSPVNFGEIPRLAGLSVVLKFKIPCKCVQDTWVFTHLDS